MSSNELRRDAKESSESTDTLSRRDMLRLSGAGAAAVAGAMTFRVGRAAPVSERKIRLGVVGGGFGTSFYWHEHPNCVVTGVTDLRPERRERLKAVYHCDAVYDSLEEMSERADDIDAVAVFSGALDHVKHAQMCFARGWHVVSAVPACFTLEEAEQLKEAAERSGLSYMMAETSYYRQPAILAREMHAKGAFGNLFYTEAEYYHDRGDLERLAADKSTRFFEPDGSHSWRWGLPPMHYPTHSTGLLVGVTGERITKVSCLGWGGHEHPYVTDNAYDNPYWNQASIMQTDRGNMLRCNVFWLCSAHGERAQWMGDNAMLYMDKGGVHGPKLHFRTAGETASRYDLPVQDGGDVDVPIYWQTDMLPEAMRHNSGHGGSHTFLSAEFINALVEDRPPAIDLYESLAMTVPGIVAHQSARKGGEQLAVPQFDRAG
ncbi:Gfo/Idh/MocA family protein [Aeoliella sp.]|uniref:Gfo/Idh/MocA family protein n=1 Tax=Aeoliella sp. TaxID=2795800 RepID=UPI003CCBA8A2